MNEVELEKYLLDLEGWDITREQKLAFLAQLSRVMRHFAESAFANDLPKSKEEDCRDMAA